MRSLEQRSPRRKHTSLITGHQTGSGRFTADAGTSAPLGPATSVVVVQPGESLWQIAQQIAPALDPREVVTAIRALNGLGDSTVIAGQSIVVPVLDAAPLAS